MSALSPFVTTYATTTPYVTLAEFLAAPTALDLTDLIQGGTQAQQNQAMLDTILRASSWVDEITNQILACTVDVERDWYRVNAQGTVRVPLHYKPILEVTGVSLGRSPSTLQAITDFSNVAVNKYVVEIPVSGAASSVGGLGVGSQALVDVTYINGWVCTTTTGAVTAGATALPVASALGVYPGTRLQISDGANTETVTVASTYTSGGLSLPLTAPLAFAHAAGIATGNLPTKVKEATILLTSVLIQTRGSDAIILDSTESPGRESTSYGASGENVAIAMELLESLKRVW